MIFPRLDPLSHFHRYVGGFNVTSMHYWSSLACTGIWGYAMAAACFVWGVWSIRWQYLHWRQEVKLRFATAVLLQSVPVTLCVILFGTLLLSGRILNPKIRVALQQIRGVQLEERLGRIGLDGFLVHHGEEIYGGTTKACRWSCRAASGVIFWGNSRLGDELKMTACTLVGSADRVALQVDDAVNLIPLSKIGPIANQDVAKKFLSACSDLRRTFRNLTHKLKVHRDYIYGVSSMVKIVVTTVASLMVIVVIIGILTMFRSWPALLFHLLCIFTVVASWLVAGFSFVLAIFAVDGCEAIQAYTRNPHNSSIARILPCLTPQGAAEALSGAKNAIKTVIQRSNAAVDLLNHQEQKLAATSTLVPHPPTLPHICDPFGPGPDFFPVGCNAEEGSFARFGEDYGKYCCDSDDIDSCLTSSTPIPKFAFMDASQAMNATRDVYMILPTVFRIITCDFVTLTFEDITMHHCGPLQGWLAMLWISFVVASLALTLLVLLCDRHGRTQSNDRALTSVLETKPDEESTLLLAPASLSRSELNVEISRTGTGNGAAAEADVLSSK